MTNFCAVFLLVFLVGCNQSSEVRQYTEVVVKNELPDKPMHMQDPHAGLGMNDPHAGLDMSDPHAGLDMNDPHAGLNMQDPHAGMDMAQAPAAFATTNESGGLVWETPSGWVQKPASSMRLATFQLADDPAAIDVSIVSLPGNAGGVEANIKRWMGQIGLSVPEDEFKQFLSAALNHTFDFTQLQKSADPVTESMIAAMINVDGSTVFIKMKGSIAALSKNKSAFLGLVKSIRLK